MLPAVLMLLVAACGEDATPTSPPAPDPTGTSAPDPTATPEPEPEPTATPEPEPDVVPPPAGSQEFSWVPEFGPCPAPCIIADNFSIEDGKFEFRVGDDINPDGLFGFPQGARVPSIFADGIVIGPFEVGTTFRFNTVRMSGSRSTKDHYFIIKGLENNCREGTPESPANDACIPGPDIRYEYSLDGTRVEEPWQYTFTTAGEFIISSGDASGDDPPDEHGNAKFVVVDSSGGGGADAGPVTYTFGDFVVEDGKFELRMGAEAYFGYDAEQRIPTIPGLIEIVFGPIQVGDTLSFARCRQSGSRSSVTHHFTVEALGIDYNLDDGRFGADPPGGAFGDSDDPTNNCELTFDAPGEYLITDSTDPDGHGVAKVIVEGDAMVAETVVYTLDEIRVRDTVFELRMGDEAHWGYDAGLRVRTDEVGDITISINVGDSLVFPDGFTGSGSSTETHFLTIDEFGIDAEIAPGADTNLGITITAENAGTFLVYCSAHPDPAVHGVFNIVVS